MDRRMGRRGGEGVVMMEEEKEEPFLPHVYVGAPFGGFWCLF